MTLPTIMGHHENELLDVLNDEGIGYITFSPLAKGILTDKTTRLNIGKSVTSVLIGASKVSQIEDCVTTLDHLFFTEKKLQKIDKILAAEDAV